MKQKRIWQMLGASGALAACIAIAFAFGPGSHQRVEAAMIFNSLRDALRRSIWIEFSDIESEGVHADGRVLIVFDDEAPLNDDGQRPVRATYVDVHVEADADHEDLHGLQVEIAGASRANDRWAFIRAANLPAELIAEAPPLALFTQALSNGIVIDMSDLPQGLPFMSGQMSLADGPDEIDSTGVLKLGVGVGEADFDEAIDLGDDADSDGFHTSMRVSIGGDANLSTTEESSAPGQPPSDAVLQQHLGLMEGLLTGTATAEQIEGLIDTLQASAQTVVVTPLGDGMHRLHASGFDAEIAGDDSDVIIEITYHETNGVEFLDVSNIGEGTGRFRIEFKDAGENDPLFDRGRYATRENVQQLNANGLLGMLGIEL